MTRCPTFNFQVSIMSKWLAKHKSTKVSFKITIRKRHVYNWHSLTLKMKPVILFWICEDELSKIIFLHSFQLVTRLYSQKRNEKSLLMNPDTLICKWILAFPIGIIQVSTSRKWIFYFISVPYTITDLLPF